MKKRLLKSAGGKEIREKHVQFPSREPLPFGGGQIAPPLESQQCPAFSDGAAFIQFGNEDTAA